MGGHGPGKVAVVRLPKAEVLTVRMSTAIADEDLLRSGIVRWLIDNGALPLPPWPAPGSDPTLLRQLRRGEHWMVTPYRTLTLVHAVRRPLLAPEYLQLAIQRQLGWTFAELAGRLSVSTKSTGKLELVASWDDPIDNGPDADEDPFVRSVERAFVVEVSLDPANYPGPDLVDVRGDRHEFGDTKYRAVRYGALATTKFAEHFTESAELTLPQVLPGAPDGVAVTTVKVRSTGSDPVTFGKDVDFEVDPDASTISLPAGSAIDAGQTVHVDYVPLPIARPNEQPLLAKAILSTARPAAPDVVYIVPTFRWSDSRAGSTINSQRLGGGLRIYLQRPWWSSGDGEQLGVVIFPAVLGADPPADVAPYVTRWGNDPVHGTAAAPVKAFVAPTDFPLASGRASRGRSRSVRTATWWWPVTRWPSMPSATSGTATCRSTRGCRTGRSCAWRWRATSPTRSTPRRSTCRASSPPTSPRWPRTGS